MKRPLIVCWFLSAIAFCHSATWIASAYGATEVAPDYSAKVAPIFKKYCAGCHNAQDNDGKLSLESFADLQKGGEHGPAVLPGQGESSRLIRVLTGKAEPKMPPEDKPAPTAEEVALLKLWIDKGAKGPDGAEPDRKLLMVPKIKPAAKSQVVASLAYSPNGKQLAIGKTGEVEIRDADSNQVLKTLKPLPSKVNSVHYSADGGRLITASGVPGLFGEATIWDAASGEKVAEFSGHRDTMFDAELSPDGKQLATCSYDRKILIWSVESKQVVRTIEGHNDAVYDLAFSPDGRVLASAAGDKTVKLWNSQTGERLDTLSQPQGEQMTVAFSPDGKHVVAGGADNRIRVWKLVSIDKPQINPLLYARFAHEGAVLRIAFSPDGSRLVSVAQDQSLKLWETENYSEIKLYERQPDEVTSLAIRPASFFFSVGRLDGTLSGYGLLQIQAASVATTQTAPMVTQPDVVAERREHSEAEPNDDIATANAITLPALVHGSIDVLRDGQREDADLFRFTSEAGKEWVLEINASRQKSPLDSRIEVLDTAGKPIPRVMLQAVRDSYFTFRGKDSEISDDFRVQNWEEMELNDYLYSDGEVVRLWLYPRGPDSGFKVYPGAGKRWTYFDTSPVAHAVFAPCYIVRPVSPGTSLIPNGLPVFPVYFENDDDALRQLGTDSRLTFTAPASGDFLVRVRDARGFEGEDYKYDLTIRPRQPDFKVTLAGANPTINAGSGKEFSVTAERIDGFDGEIRIAIDGLPPGFHASTPLSIEPGQVTALGTINATADAPQPTAENSKTSKIVATAIINGKEVAHEVNSLSEMKLAGKPKILISMHPSAEHPRAVVSNPNDQPSADKPLELVIAPGETISAVVRVERNGFDARVPLGTADSGRNLGHGVFIDNIGLNGLMIVEGQNERTFFITASKIANEGTRYFHLRADVEANQTSWPVKLHVRRPVSVAGGE